ncbi:MAG TPA: GNAT family N-acetyltransferase [Candidatus Eubacterium faecipullorum]|uniref:GNAT family N-acetyltransferase n=1 Tax=Candidatus Eubacterium faecipullorum TaxID=2838571 RepID=A0A9D1UGK2_9FIRM|nr:GNAT family N-acetyltransferase [Candidatus Eubacterium faecipullorum]
MIRRFRNEDTDSVMHVWLDANMQAHSFIPQEFWKNNFEYAKEQIPKAETYVYEKDGAVLGFISLNGSYIEGLFVRKEYRALGIGTALLDFVKEKKSSLLLHVYCQNTGAVDFYIKNSFSVKEKLSDAPADEYVMLWEKGYEQ